MTGRDETSLTLRRRLKASPERVYDAWTKPELMMRWWGPAGAEMLEAETDLRIGGRFRTRFREPGGAIEEAEGEYLEIEPGRRLVMDWFWTTQPEEGRSLLTVTIEPHGDGSTLTVTHARLQDKPTRDGHEDGWSGALDRLEAALADTSFSKGEQS